MKRFVVLFFIMLIGQMASAQIGKELYDKYSGKAGVSAVYISPAMYEFIQQIPDIDIGDENINISGIIKSFEGMYILSVEGSEDGENGRAKDEIESYVQSLSIMKKKDFILLAEAIDDGTKVQIHCVKSGDIITDLLVFAKEESETVLISVTGKIPMEALQQLIASATR